MPARSLIAAALCAVLLLVLLAGVLTTASQPIDDALITALFSERLREPLGFLAPVTELGSTLSVTIVAVALLPAGLALGVPLQGAAGALTIALASVVNSLVKVWVARQRPELIEPVLAEGGYSFPSGHAALSMVAYGITGVLVARSRLPLVVRVVAVVVLALVVLAVGVSRVYLGVHYATDVAAGWCAGGIVVAIYAWWTGRAARAEAAAGAMEEGARDRAVSSGRG
jgi:membrane-associated phospholipid phosphatase